MTALTPSTNLAGHCQLCGGPNECRLESGEAYKGPCWCERPTLPSAALARLTEDLPDPRCLCPKCLERIAANPAITRDELAAGENDPPES